MTMVSCGNMNQEDRTNQFRDHLTRRRLMQYGAAGGAAMVAGCGDLQNPEGSGSGNGDSGNGDSGNGDTPQLSLAAPPLGFPVEEPLGSSFMESYDVDLSVRTVTAQPTQIIQQFVAGDGQAEFDGVWANGGGMEQLMYDEDIIAPIDIDQINNWENADDAYKEGGVYRSTLEADGNVVGSPSVQNVDSVAHNLDVMEEVDSWGVVYDEEWRGQTAVLDDYANTPHHTALYLDQNNMADIQGETQDPTPYSNLQQDEIELVVDFLIDKKEAGQFQTIWSSFGNFVEQLVSGEIAAGYTYQPAVLEAERQGAEVGYPPLKEGNWEWNDHWFMTQGGADRGRQQQFYQLCQWALEPETGAYLHDTQGYESGCNQDLVIDWMEDNWEEERVEKNIQMIEDRQERYDANGDVMAWNNPNPTHLEFQLDEWNRFLSA